jgi:hypothetical protein
MKVIQYAGVEGTGHKGQIVLQANSTADRDKHHSGVLSNLNVRHVNLFRQSLKLNGSVGTTYRYWCRFFEKPAKKKTDHTKLNSSGTPLWKRSYDHAFDNAWGAGYDHHLQIKLSVRRARSNNRVSMVYKNCYFTG